MILKLKNKMCVYEQKDVKREEENECEACKIVYDEETEESKSKEDDDDD